MKHLDLKIGQSVLAIEASPSFWFDDDYQINTWYGMVVSFDDSEVILSKSGLFGIKLKKVSRNNVFLSYHHLKDSLRYMTVCEATP